MASNINSNADDEGFPKYYREMTDEECVTMVSESIKIILRASPNEDFRQKIFGILEVSNAVDAGEAFRQELSKRIRLPLVSNHKTLEQLQMDSQASKQQETSVLSSSSASAASQSQSLPLLTSSQWICMDTTDTGDNSLTQTSMSSQWIHTKRMENETNHNAIEDLDLLMDFQTSSPPSPPESASSQWICTDKTDTGDNSLTQTSLSSQWIHTKRMANETNHNVIEDLLMDFETPRPPSPQESVASTSTTRSQISRSSQWICMDSPVTTSSQSQNINFTQ